MTQPGRAGRDEQHAFPTIAREEAGDLGSPAATRRGERQQPGRAKIRWRREVGPDTLKAQEGRAMEREPCEWVLTLLLIVLGRGRAKRQLGPRFQGWSQGWDIGKALQPSQGGKIMEHTGPQERERESKGVLTREEGRGPGSLNPLSFPF